MYFVYPKSPLSDPNMLADELDLTGLDPEHLAEAQALLAELAAHEKAIEVLHTVFHLLVDEVQSSFL